VDEPPVTISATSCRGQYLVIADRGVKHSDTDADAKIEIFDAAERVDHDRDTKLFR